MQLEGKVNIVTGSAGGIGRAIAIQCAREGARLVITDRNEEGARETAAIIGEAATVHIDDLQDPGAAGRIVQSALSAYGEIHGVVNNAAFIPRSDIHTTDATLFDNVMAVNVRAPLMLIQAALPHLKQTHGSVLNIGSVNAYCGEVPLLAYSISKGALMTMSRNLGDGLHHHHGIRVNQINPGWVLTDNEFQLKVADGLPSDWPGRLPRSVAPSGGLIGPETIAAAAIYWLSDASRPVSGAVVDLEQYPMIGRNPPKEVAGPNA